jgi:uncharacterized protein (TIGR02246 family)
MSGGETVRATRKGLVVGVATVFILYGRPARSEDVRAAVEAGNRAFIAAFMKGDAEAVANFYTENAQVIAPGAPVVRGRPAIAAFWGKSIKSGVKELALTTADVDSSGDLASETGVVRIVARDGTVTQARYLVVWQRTNGEWKLHRDIWNAE